MTHIQSLDGIRGFAVVLVVLFHTGTLQFGWVGVQLFFVLSGFLITGILLGERSRPLVDYLARFYWRRSLRIFPLYFFFLALAAIAFAVAHVPASFERDWPWLLTYTTNFGRMREIDVGPAFVHLWSLAVEEQFYLVWPLMVFALPVAAFKRLVLGLLVFCPLSRLGFYLAYQNADLDWLGRSIYGLPTSQFDAFAAGAAIALWPTKFNGQRLAISIATLAICGAAVLAHQHLAYHAAQKWSYGYAMFLLQDGGFVWAYTLINVTAACGIAYAIKTAPTWLNDSPLARVGTVSYGIYVYHIPLLLCLEQLHLARFMMLPIYLSLVYAFAEISYCYLELPFLQLKDAHPRASKDELTQARPLAVKPPPH